MPPSTLSVGRSIGGYIKDYGRFILEHHRSLAVPVAGQPIENGILLVDGERIVSIDPPRSRTPDFDLGNAAILPGLVNAHTHLDLSGMRDEERPRGSFTDWLRRVIAFRRSSDSISVVEAIQSGLDECRRHGTTLVGDISSDGSSWAELAEAPLRAVVFRELLGLTKDRAELAWQTAQAWLGACRLTATCRPGLSPHAPYSARVSLMKSSAATIFPLAIHLAESVEERELLVDQAGPFVPFLQHLGVWDPVGLAKSPEHVAAADGAAGTDALHTLQFFGEHRGDPHFGKCRVLSTNPRGVRASPVSVARAAREGSSRGPGDR